MNKYCDINLTFNHRISAIKVHNYFRKYAATDKLAYLVAECVEESVKEIKSKIEINKPFVVFDYTYLIFANIMLMSATGKR